MAKEIEKLEIDKCGVMETGLCEQEYNTRHRRVHMGGKEQVNTVYPGMNEWTWKRGEVGYILDYIMVNERLLKKTVETKLWELDEVIESDHRGIGKVIRWRRVRKKRKGI